MASSIEVGGAWTNVRRGQNLGDEAKQKKGKPLHIAPQLNNACSRPVVCSMSEIMALLHHPKKNTPPRRDPVEPLLPMIDSSLYLIVLDYEDQEYFNCMMSE
ncbi:hypothetical protein L3X38_001465 [Prunus dulcis]|uniref:Uncharacterized protein n=1 Tax=Prunus dulcis TaxID=3755 RepID=A0AAD4ZKD3_PRUDU|nr:hypothetical protein L3X38_001465 [Prunus dulcis]